MKNKKKQPIVAEQKPIKVKIDFTKTDKGIMPDHELYAHPSLIPKTREERIF